MSETQKMSPKGAIIECASCGAHFDEMMPKCPYCGSMSIYGQIRGCPFRCGRTDTGAH